jgi:hypothetical protein
MKSETLKKTIILLFFISLYLNSTTYYTSPSGNNSYSGSQTDPWASPGYGSKQISTGDTMIIGRGEYALRIFWEDMITPPSGTPDAWTLIQGEPGNRPVLKGSNNLFSAIELSGVHYIRLANLEITSDNGADFRVGVAAWDPSDYVILEKLFIHHIDETGMDFRDIRNLHIQDCVLDHCGFGGIGGPAGAAGGWRFVTISNCSLTWSGHYYQGVIGPGISPYDRPDGFGIEPSEGPVEISHCLSSHNRGDGLDSKAARTTIHHSIVANNRCDGIKLWGDSSIVFNCLIYGTGDDEHDSPWASLVIDNIDIPGYYFEVCNTTIHDNPERPAYPMYVQYSGSASLDLVMKNNIISNGHGVVYFGEQVHLTAENNCFYRPGESEQVTANGRDYTSAEIEQGDLGTGNLSRDPLFAAPAWGIKGDYHLQPASPIIDRGKSGRGIPDDDLEYKTRPLGSEIDMGALEFNPIALTARLFLEGSYIVTDDSMTTDLSGMNAIPITAPYTEDPRTIASVPENITDWILLELRQKYNGTAVLSKSVLLRRDGFLVSDDGLSLLITLNENPGYYFLILRHRNHIPVMSADSIYFSTQL